MLPPGGRSLGRLERAHEGDASCCGAQTSDDGIVGGRSSTPTPWTTRATSDATASTRRRCACLTLEVYYRYFTPLLSVGISDGAEAEGRVRPESPR